MVATSRPYGGHGLFSELTKRAHFPVAALQVNFPRMGLGTNTFGVSASYAGVDESGVRRIVDVALDEGVSLFDTAEIYSEGESERWLGEALKGRRHQATIVSKFNPTSDPRQACEASLRRLQTDYIDVYLLHFPNPNKPIAATLVELESLQAEGKVRMFGSSNFAGWQIADADWTSRSNGSVRFQVAQNRYSLLERHAENDVVPACLNFGIKLMPFQPLAAGLLTGKYRRNAGLPPGSRFTRSPSANKFLRGAMFDKVEALSQFANTRGVDLLSVAIGGLASMPAVATVITGVTSPEQVRTNASAATWRASEEDLAEIKRITTDS